jgi:hypothetical protein
MTPAYHIIVDALQANGSHVVERGAGKAQAQCPAHDDHNPSLSIFPRADGKGTQLKCHAGCDVLDVLAGLGLTTRDLFDDPEMRAVYGDRATYAYSDGRRVHRKPDKSFPQSGTKTGNALFGAERIGDACLVYVPEGEKDCLAIKAVGGTAVCSAMGAGKAHLADWSPLSGLDVIVIADKDRAGHAHARDIVGLLAGKAHSVRVVTAAVGKDTADHIAAGLGLHEFVPIDDTARNGAQLGDEFVTVTLSAVTPERVRWLWADRIPAGKLVILDGDPELGKSTLALTFAAIITTGGRWPDGSDCLYPGDVVLLSAEDGIADTVRPRADAAGADVARIHVVQGVPIPGEDHTLRLPTLADIAQLRRLVDATGARLVIVDVLMAYLPTATDSYKDQDVRSVLARLAALADVTGATVLLLRHLTKGSKGMDPLYRGGGSIGIVGAARAGMLVAHDPDDHDRQVLAWTKSNLAPTPDSLAYRLIDTEPLHVGRIEWGGASEHTARTLLTHPEDGGEGIEYYSATAEAQRWLEDYLGLNGSCLSGDVKADAAKLGIKERTLQYAANNLSVIVESSGFPRVTRWSIAPQSRQSRLTQKVSATSATEGNDGATEPSPPPGFVPPKGPGRCDECGFHTPTQGHRDTCSKHIDERNSPP